MKYLIYPIAALIVGTSLGLGNTYYEFVLRPSRFELGGIAPDESKGPLQSDPSLGRSRVEVVNGETHDFGKMDINSKDKHVFTFKNNGTSPMTIKVLQTSCKCTVADLPNGHIEPGETADVTLEWTPKDEDPEFSQSAQIQTSDTDRPVVVLRVVGRVRMQLFVQPVDVLFANVSTNETVTSTVRLLSHEHETMEFKGYECANAEFADYFAVDAKPMSPEEAATYSESKSGMVINVTLKPGLPHGPINQMIQIFTNIQEKSGKVIPIRGDIVGDVLFHGRPGLDRNLNRLSLGVIKEGESRTETVHLVVRGPYRDELKLTIAEDGIQPPDLIKATIGEPKTVGKTRMFPVSISIPPGGRPVVLNGPSEDHYGKIVFGTSHPNVKEITLYLGFIIDR